MSQGSSASRATARDDLVIGVCGFMQHWSRSPAEWIQQSIVGLHAQINNADVCEPAVHGQRIIIRTSGFNGNLDE